jgi:fermentation-respiration switch protein FrsA (DUF1100 family)
VHPRGVLHPLVKVLLSIAVVFGAAYVLLLALLWSQQERVVFQPPRSSITEPVSPTGDVALRQVSYRAADDTPLFAYVVGDPANAPRVLLAFHGNADLARWVVPWAAEVVRATGAAVLLPEYRGYDGLVGPPTYAGITLDARAALQFARDSLHIPARRLAYFGHSLGSAVATQLAIEAPPQVLVLQSPFTSARAMAQRMLVPGLALFWRAISRVHYDTRDAVRSLSVPLWVVHGDNDVIIPVRMGREVLEAARIKGELLIVRGAGHNDVTERGGTAYWEWLRRALSSSAAHAGLPGPDGFRP